MPGFLTFRSALRCAASVPNSSGVTVSTAATNKEERLNMTLLEAVARRVARWSDGDNERRRQPIIVNPPLTLNT